MRRRRRRSTSEYRLRLTEEDRRQLALDLAGLLPQAPEPPRRTFGEVGADWLARLVRVRPDNEERHCWQLWPLWQLRDPGVVERDDDLTKAGIEACLKALDVDHGGTLGPSSLNKLLSTGKLVVDDAIANRRWHSANPFDFVTRRRVPRQPWPRITADELGRVLACLRPDRMRECIWQIHAGTRPGELKALRKSDVDLERGFVTVHRSNARNQTKTGRTREVPIPRGARDALIEAMRLSPSELVFPRPDGRRQREDVKLSKVLRSAFKRAGVVTGYRFMCRRKGCGYRDEQLLSDATRRCPRCDFKLWCEGMPKHFTWYQLRHAAATLLRERGADAHAVKSALGWAQRDVGDDVYTHLSDERFKAEMDKLVIAPTPPHHSQDR